MKIEVAVLGGLPVTIEFTTYDNDVDEWRIIEIAGRALRKKESADWIYKRLSKRDEKAMEKAMLEKMRWN